LRAHLSVCGCTVSSDQCWNFFLPQDLFGLSFFSLQLAGLFPDFLNFPPHSRVFQGAVIEQCQPPTGRVAKPPPIFTRAFFPPHILFLKGFEMICFSWCPRGRQGHPVPFIVQLFPVRIFLHEVFLSCPFYYDPASCSL